MFQALKKHHLHRFAVPWLPFMARAGGGGDSAASPPPPLRLALALVAFLGRGDDTRDWEAVLVEAARLRCPFVSLNQYNTQNDGAAVFLTL